MVGLLFLTFTVNIAYNYFMPGELPYLLQCDVADGSSVCGSGAFQGTRFQQMRGTIPINCWARWKTHPTLRVHVCHYPDIPRTICFSCIHACFRGGREPDNFDRSIFNRSIVGRTARRPSLLNARWTISKSGSAADSFKEIHPIERCALTITRIVDVWPFEYGNLTTAIVFANKSLGDAGLAPFFVRPEHRREFEQAVASSMTIEMQPLINAIYQTVKREMMTIGK
jgi:hypothetical protein